MIEKFHTIKFGILAILTLVTWLSTYFLMRSFWRKAGAKTIQADFIKVPVTNSLTVIGIVCPLLIGLVSYLYVNFPASNYSFILGSITVFAAALILAIWETFCLLNEATKESTITLDWATDSSIVAGIGLLYSTLILGVVYLVLFFLFDLPISPSAQSPPHASGGIALTKQLPRIGQSRTDVLSALGAPTKSVSTDEIVYEGSTVDLELHFDSAGLLQKLIEQRH
jgi:hypothetical protein